MSEYLKSLEPNYAQCHIKKLTLKTGECLPDPYTSVACWKVRGKYQQVFRYYLAWCHRISYRNTKFVHKGIKDST